jgi:hypothetical protein
MDLMNAEVVLSQIEQIVYFVGNLEDSVIRGLFDANEVQLV